MRILHDAVRTFKITGILLFFTLLLTGCSGKIGYLVIIYPEADSPLEAASVLSVKSESSLRNSYTVKSGTQKKYVEIEKFRGMFFKKKADAENYSKDFFPYRNMYAYSKKKVSVRSSPDETSSRVYILRESGIIKITGKEEKLVKIGDLEGYWYAVLTEDGVSGYCFDKNLLFFENTEHSMSEKDGSDSELYIESFFDNRWYPMEYRETIESPYCSLDILRNGEVLFADKEKHEVILRTKGNEIGFKYSEITETKDNNFVFEGTPLEILFYPGGKLFIRYAYKGTDCSGFYTLLEKDLKEYIKEETNRRSEAYALLIKEGSYFTGESCGTLVLEKGRKFSWKGCCGPKEMSGIVKNDFFISDSLKQNHKYEGALTFVFADSSKEMTFIYKKTGTGDLELIYIPDEYISEGIISAIPKDFKIFLFKQSAAPGAE